MHDRHVRLEAVFNLRDLGGYETADGRTVRWRTLFRGDGLHRLEADALAGLGVRTVLDLRTEAEISGSPGRHRRAAEGIAPWPAPARVR